MLRNTTRTTQWTAMALVATLGAGMILTPLTARASEEGRKNTALGLGAAAVALLLTQRNKLPGILAAGGAAYAYSRYDDDVRNRHRRENEYGYAPEYRRPNRDDGYRDSNHDGYHNREDNSYFRDNDHRDRDNYNRDNDRRRDYDHNHDADWNRAHADWNRDNYRVNGDHDYSDRAARLHRSDAYRNR